MQGVDRAPLGHRRRGRVPRAPRRDAARGRRSGGADARSATSRAVPLEAMNALERKVIHEHLKARHDVETYSEGQEPVAPSRRRTRSSTERRDRRRSVIGDTGVSRFTLRHGSTLRRCFTFYNGGSPATVSMGRRYRRLAMAAIERDLAALADRFALAADTAPRLGALLTLLTEIHWRPRRSGPAASAARPSRRRAGRPRARRVRAATRSPTSAPARACPGSRWPSRSPQTTRLTWSRATAANVSSSPRAAARPGVANAIVVPARAEAWADGIGRCDVVTARALAPLAGGGRVRRAAAARRRRADRVARAARPRRGGRGRRGGRRARPALRAPDRGSPHPGGPTVTCSVWSRSHADPRALPPPPRDGAQTAARIARSTGV